MGLDRALEVDDIHTYIAKEERNAEKKRRDI